MSLSSKSRASKRSESSLPTSPSHVTILARKKRQQAEMAMKATKKVALEKILGLTTVNNSGLALCPITGFIAYPAGCVVVLFNSKKNKFHYLLNVSRKPISSLAFSHDGKYLAVGEAGHNPAVRIWDITSSNEEHVVELTGHNYGISCTAFSPNLKYFVSVGYQHDMMVNVWNWKTATVIASNKVSSKVYGLDFSEDGSYFVTVGNRHVKFWHFDSQSKANLTHPLRGRSAILGDHRNKCFMAVSCGKGSLATRTYCITKSGFLCLFNKERRLESFIECKIGAAHSVALSPDFVFCAGSEGTIRLFDPCSLEYRETVPKPHPLGVDISTALDASQFTGDGDKYADTVALAVDVVNRRLACVYNDHSLYVWDWSNVGQIGKVYSSLYHNACIWDIDFYPHLEETNASLIPPSCFATCSSDATIRFWSISKAASPVKNIYSKELSKIMYTDTDSVVLKDISKLPGDARVVADSSRGIRSVRFSPDGNHLAVGDRAGNLKVHDLQFMDVLYEVEAHDAEILSIEYTNPSSSQYLMATSSRDRLIHVFNTRPEYTFIQTLDDHSASIPAVKFNVSVNCLQLLSCSVDKSIVFRTLETKPELGFQRSNHLVSKANIYDMDIDASRKNMATVGQDRILRIYSIAQGKQIRYYKASESDEGTILKVTMDPSGMFVATSCSDKSLYLYDFYSGECLAKLYGHSEVVTAVKFSPDCKRLLSVGGDGCVFVWRLSPELTRVMHDRLMELGRKVPASAGLDSARRETYFVSKKDRTSATASLMSSFDNEEWDFTEPPPTDDRDEDWFRFSMSQLPAWAQKRMVEGHQGGATARDIIDQKESANQHVNVDYTVPSGAWAERVGDQAITTVEEKLGCVRPIQTGNEPTDGFVTKRGEVTTMDDLEVQNFSDSEEADANVEEEVIYPSTKPDIVRKNSELFRSTLPIRVESTDDIPEDFVSDDDEIPPESPLAATPANDVFVMTHFEGSGIDADQLFSSVQPLEQSVDKRMSISTRFLSSSGEKQRSVSSVVTASSSAVVLRKRRSGSIDSFPTVTVSEPNLLVEPASDSSHKPIKLSSKHKAMKQANNNNNSSIIGRNLQKSALSVSDTSLNKIPHKRANSVKPSISKSVSKEDVKSSDSSSPEQAKRNVGFMADVDKTRKRLEELGLAAPTKPKAKSSETSFKESDKEPQTAITATMDHSDTPMPLTRQQSRSRRSSKEGRQLPPLPMPTSSHEMPSKSVAAATTKDDDNSKPSKSHIEMVENIIRDLDFNLKQLMDIHKESLAKCEHEGNIDDDQVVATIATAVSNVKAQSVNWYTKYRSRWKKCKARVAGREKAITRSISLDSKKAISHDYTLDTTDSTNTTSSSGSATVASIPPLPTDQHTVNKAADQTGDHTTDNIVQGATGFTRDPEVLALLEKYSSELVAMVKQKL